MTYEFHSLRDVDVEQWARLTAVTAEADGHTTVYRPDDLRHGFGSVDVDRDGWQVLEGSRLVAVAVLYVRPAPSEGRAAVWLDAWVDPADRGRGVGRALLDRQESRAVEAAAECHPGLSVRLRSHAAERATGCRRLLERRGYRLARWFVELHLDLAQWTPPEASDAGDEPYQDELDREVRAAHAAAFADHWGSVRPDDTEWRNWFTGAPSFRPELSRVVRDPDGRVIAFALAYEFAEGEAYVGQIGVRPEHQRRGLGRATLLAVLAAAKRAGYSRSALDVDGENVHDAAALYESVGYRPLHRTAAYLRDV